MRQLFTVFLVSLGFIGFVTALLPCTKCPIDGHWSQWKAKTACTRSCGLRGTKIQTRTCLSERFKCPCKGLATRTIPCPDTLCRFGPTSACKTPYKKYFNKSQEKWVCGNLTRNDNYKAPTCLLTEAFTTTKAVITTKSTTKKVTTKAITKATTKVTTKRTTKKATTKAATKATTHKLTTVTPLRSTTTTKATTTPTTTTTTTTFNPKSTASTTPTTTTTSCGGCQQNLASLVTSVQVGFDGTMTFDYITDAATGCLIAQWRCALSSSGTAFWVNGFEDYTRTECDILEITSTEYFPFVCQSDATWSFNTSPVSSITCANNVGCP